MRKDEFLGKLQSRLRGLPPQDIEERLSFYGEMIDDRTEDGLTEEEAVREIGTVDEIVAQIIEDTPFIKLAKQRIKPKRKMRTWEIVLLTAGSPIWISLLIAAFAVVLSLHAALWSVIVSLWAVFASLVGCAVGGLIGGIVFACVGYVPSGMATLGAAVFCAGLSILAFFGCKAATKGAARLTRLMALSIKKCFVGKEDAR